MKKNLLFILILIINQIGIAQRINHVLFEDWNGANWDKDQRIIRIYLSSGELSGTLTESWDATAMTWVKSRQGLYDFDANMNIIKSTSSIWDDVNQVWKNNFRTVSTFNANQSEILEIYQTFSNGVWKDKFKDTLIYDGNNYLIERYKFYRDTLLQVWEPSNKISRTNNASGLDLEYIDQEWDRNTSTWVNKTKISKTYTSNNDLSTSKLDVWDNNNWVNQTLQNHQYDSNGYRISQLVEYWYIFNSTWNNLSNYTYTNYPDGRLDFEVRQDWDGVNNIWENKQKLTVFYDSATSIIKHQNKLEILAYPNPAKDKLFLKIPTNNNTPSLSIQLFDIHYRMVRSWDFNCQTVHELSLNGLKSGMYFLEMKGNNYHEIISVIKN